MKKKKILVNDRVKVLSGRDSGKIGTVKSVDLKQNRVVVENVNKRKQHVRGNPMTGKKGGIQEVEIPISYSNVAILCESCAKPTRVGYKITNDGSKYRFCKKCDEFLD